MSQTVLVDVDHMGSERELMDKMKEAIQGVDRNTILDLAGRLFIHGVSLDVFYAVEKLRPYIKSFMVGLSDTQVMEGLASEMEADKAQVRQRYINSFAAEAWLRGIDKSQFLTFVRTLDKADPANDPTYNVHTYNQAA